MNLYDVIKRPLITEKAELLRERGCYAFEVDKRANKILVASAIEQIYNVKPSKVNILNTRARKKVNRYGAGYRPGYKKAYVYLSGNDTIELFEGV